MAHARAGADGADGSSIRHRAESSYVGTIDHDIGDAARDGDQSLNRRSTPQGIIWISECQRERGSNRGQLPDEVGESHREPAPIERKRHTACPGAVQPRGFRPYGAR
jgi:hypothetical protein